MCRHSNKKHPLWQQHIYVCEKCILRTLKVLKIANAECLSVNKSSKQALLIILDNNYIMFEKNRKKSLEESLLHRVIFSNPSGGL